MAIIAYAMNVQHRHEPICQKTQQKKRKVFDSSKQRAEGTELTTVKKRGQPTRVCIKHNNTLRYVSRFMFKLLVPPHTACQLLPCLCTAFITASTWFGGLKQSTSYILLLCGLHLLEVVIRLIIKLACEEVSGSFFSKLTVVSGLLVNLHIEYRFWPQYCLWSLHTCPWLRPW